ncbi:SCO family protein [Bradyrhizobium sp. BR13661]|jgi:protein SCO1/2|uniref:SCO family protein n=1 Tax=Bradyrhizobium sp. BR13661 TaxID=2940622 RepID=UPI0024762C5B|nr:SCO family protein [Bradyrhizobium sp. BR13661]MDH6260773.1 protein SCO1/2 [Bradyrhizobium sp. BR13661]
MSSTKGGSPKARNIQRAYFTVTAIVVLAVLSAAIAVTWSRLQGRSSLPSSSGVGGAFSLIDQRGNRVTDRDLLGKPALVFFGFTNCPDVCPTTLTEMTGLLKELGKEASELNVLFITVDPQRDTPQQLALYLSSFDPHITGLSGTESDVAAVMAKYHVYARKIPLKDGDYTMDHTAAIYMMNRKGQFVGLMSYQEPEELSRAKLRKLLSDPVKG